MSDCAHINLIKQTGPMDGGLESTRYRCKECSEFLYAKVAENPVRYGQYGQLKQKENTCSQTGRQL